MQREALLYEKLSSERIKCNLCPHECVVKSGKAGICRVRKNIDSKFYTLNYGDAIAASCDPIEKKPLYHFLPGSIAYSVAAPGCNFRCGFCQNWRISQIDGSYNSDSINQKILPEKIVENALKNNAETIAYTYSEPTVFFEYALDTAKLASNQSIKNIFVTNGFINGEAIEKISPYLDGANIDLKYFSEESYRNICGGSLKPVLKTIEKMRELDIWVEVTTLLIPGDNDSDKELTDIAEFIASVGDYIPWHISAFSPTYKYSGREFTSVKTLQRARNIGRKAGLKYIYLGNVRGEPATSCPDCASKLFNRTGYITEIKNFKDGRCTGCGKNIEGVWN